MPGTQEGTDRNPLDDDPVPLTDACGQRVDDGPHMKVGSVILFKVSSLLSPVRILGILSNLADLGHHGLVGPQVHC